MANHFVQGNNIVLDVPLTKKTPFRTDFMRQARTGAAISRGLWERVITPRLVK